MLVTFKQLREEFGIDFCAYHIWRLQRDGRFPKRVKRGRKNFWVREEIQEWVQSLIARRDHVPLGE